LAPEDLRLRCHECTLLAHRADQAYPVVRFHGLADLALARRHVEAAVRRSEELVAWAPTRPQALRVRGFVMRLAAGHVAISGQLQAALAAERDAFAFLERAIGMPGGEPLRASDYAQAAIRMAITSRAAGLYDEGAAVLAPALLQAQHDLHDNPGDEHRQRQLVAFSQTLLDLCLHRGREAEAEALYTQAHQHLPVLTPAHEADPLCKRPWQHAWMDSLQALAWARCGRLDAAKQRLQRLHGWMHGGTLRLRDDPAALDCELEANIHIASAQLATAMGLPDEAAASAEAALERLHAMRAVRDPSDAIEAVRGWQLGVRLAVSCTGEATAALQARLVEVVRAQQAELAARGLVDPATRAESRWLAAQAAG
jgi:tetratricopeptide (TPR) repeat protein